MIRDTLDGLSEGTHGICIVGAGPVGISLAVELDRLGIPVLLLEAGKDGPDEAIQSLSDADIVDPEIHDDMRIAVARRLGGTSNLWGARCIPFDPIDFAVRPGIGGAEWPVGFDEIQPWYEAACRYTSSGRAVYEEPWPGAPISDDRFTLEALERWANEQRLQVIHAGALARSPRIDVRLRVVATRFHFAENGRVDAIDVARPDGSDTRRVRIATLVVATGGLESTRLLLAAQRQRSDLFGGPDGPLGRYYMGHVIGEIADIVFAPGTTDAAFQFYVDRHGSYVRRRFVPSYDTQLREGILNTALWPVVPPVADPRHHSGILSLVYLALAWPPLGQRIIPEAIRKRHIPAQPVDLPHHVRNVLGQLPPTAIFALSFMWRRRFSRSRLPGFFVLNRNHRYGLSYHAEQLPNPDSRVTLGGERDATGLPRLRIDLRFLPRDLDSLVRVHELFADWLATTGLGHLEYRQAESERMAAIAAQAKHGTHQIGTARMGTERRQAVVDRDLRTFDAPNLYVASAAVLPTSGQANPTLTVIALALRLAHRLARERNAARQAA